MSNVDKFTEVIANGYTTKGDSFVLGAAMLDEQHIVKNLLVKAPLRTLNRHGLIAGATGTGKTKTIQGIAESLSNKGISVFLMDIKGDLSGIAEAGDCNPKIDERHEKIGIAWEPHYLPVEMLSLSKEKGVRLRATVSEFGPVLFSKILDLNEVQSGIVSVIFKWCDDCNFPLLDLKDFKKVLQYITKEGKDEIEADYGAVSEASTGTILRKVIELEQQGADVFFGERSFDPRDLIDIRDGKGLISVVRLMDLQDRPKLFSTFMLSLLTEIYATFPEVGDAEKPKLVFFIDEAHLIFNEASKALLDQIETIIKLIRSKGVGIFFCTQNPSDIPDAVLSQLGMKIQHALRAFTAKDRKMIKLTAENYPLSDFYQVDELLTSLGIGEAAVTVLDEKGRPTPLARTLLCAPGTRMDVLNDVEMSQLIARSQLAATYNEVIDRHSAYEILNQKIQTTVPPVAEKTDTTRTVQKAAPVPKEEPSFFDTLSKNRMVKQVGTSLVREVTRGLMGMFFGKRR